MLINNFTNADIKKNSDFRLSPSRQHRADLLSEKEKERFISAEKITMNILSDCFSLKNPEIYGNAGEKPTIDNQEKISFSRSYSENILALALEDSEAIGIDSEKIKTADESIIRYFFTRREKEYIQNSGNKDFAFTLIWTRKESFIKYTGEGLKYEFNLLDTTPDRPVRKGQKLFDKNLYLNGLYINSYRIDHTVISVCSKVNDKFPLFIQKGW